MGLARTGVVNKAPPLILMRPFAFGRPYGAQSLKDALLGHALGYLAVEPKAALIAADDLSGDVVALVSVLGR